MHTSLLHTPFFPVSNRHFEPLDPLEFGFVFLPDDEVMKNLHVLGQTVYDVIQSMPRLSVLPSYWGSYTNHAVRIPHLSIGQYGLLACERDNLTAIVNEIAQRTPPIIQKMASEVSIVPGYIFLDAAEIFDHVNATVKKTYIDLRERFMNEIDTKFRVSGVLFAKKHFRDCQDELNLIEQHFQNWGTPEHNRMRPHFTLHYHPPFDEKSMIDGLGSNGQLRKQLDALSTITLTRLGIVQIDAFGNTLNNGLLYACPLNG